MIKIGKQVKLDIPISDVVAFQTSMAFNLVDEDTKHIITLWESPYDCETDAPYVYEIEDSSATLGEIIRKTNVCDESDVLHVFKSLEKVDISITW